MEHLHSGYTLELAPGSFPLSTDSIALAGFVRLPKRAAVLDLGSGCGTLGLLLCGKDPDCCVTGIELSPEDHQTALRNALQNGIPHRLTSICGDLRSIPDFLQPGSFQVCVSNPPYYTGGFQSSRTPQARHTDTCSTEELFRAAGWALKYGGDFFLVHKPNSLAQLCHHAVSHQLEPKKLQLLRHKEGGPISLILLQCRKGAKPGLVTEEAALHTPDGSATDFYKSLYHL